MKPPTISIAMPVYNVAPFVEDALRSVFAQTFADWELIVADDGSGDGTLAILESLRDERVRVFADGTHCGFAARLNQIVEASRGRYIARMDGDDLLDPERLRKQWEFLEENQQVDGVGCAMAVVNREMRPVALRRFPTQHDEIVADPLRGVRIAHATFMGRVGWFRAHPYLVPDAPVYASCEDWELWFTSYRQSRFANLQEPLYFYREFNSFDLRKYIHNRRRAAARQWALARRECGLLRTSAEVVQHYLKIGTYLAASAVGMQDFFVRRRSEGLSGPEQAQFAAVLEQVQRTPLPQTCQPSAQ